MGNEDDDLWEGFSNKPLTGAVIWIGDRAYDDMTWDSMIGFALTDVLTTIQRDNLMVDAGDLATMLKEAWTKRRLDYEAKLDR